MTVSPTCGGHPLMRGPANPRSGSALRPTCARNVDGSSLDPATVCNPASAPVSRTGAHIERSTVGAAECAGQRPTIWNLNAVNDLAVKDAYELTAR
jgi:hypothetical protein